MIIIALAAWWKNQFISWHVNFLTHIINRGETLLKILRGQVGSLVLKFRGPLQFSGAYIFKYRFAKIMR